MKRGLGLLMHILWCMKGNLDAEGHEMNAHRGQTVFDTDAVPVVQAPDLQGSGEASLQVRVWSYVGGARVRRWGMAEPMLPDVSLPTLRSRDEREKLTPPSARPEAKETLGDYVVDHQR